MIFNKLSLGRIFISYAHKDNESDDPKSRWLDRLKEHLGALASEGFISYWSDKDIEIGENWHQNIQENLVSTKVAVLLVSPAFLSSEYIRKNELPILLKRSKETGVKILPIILRPCLFRTTKFKYPDPVKGPDEFSLAELQSSNPPEKALSELNESEQDRILLSVCERIQRIVNQDIENEPCDRTLKKPEYRLEVNGLAGTKLTNLNRERLIKRVRADWIAGLLEQQLPHLARLRLGLEPKPIAVQKPWDLVLYQSKNDYQPLPHDAPISMVFKDLSEAMLILGKPGAGKTILLLELARDLLVEAEQDLGMPIPVVFHLSTWAEHRGKLAEWLVDELNKRYDVPRRLGKEWADKGQILPLLDGLDEMKESYRSHCIDVINEFRREQGQVPIAVCCRIAEYETLPVRLKFSGAVAIQPLTRNQVHDYLLQLSDKATGLRSALIADDTLWDLLDTPLMLAVATIAYGGKEFEEVGKTLTLENRKRQLFAAYVDEMFQRPGRAKSDYKGVSYAKEQTIAWITWLSNMMKRHNQSMFYLGWMQPVWFIKQSERTIFRAGVGMLCALVISLILFANCMLFSELTYERQFYDLSFWMPVSALVGLSACIKKRHFHAFIISLIICMIYWTWKYAPKDFLTILLRPDYYPELVEWIIRGNKFFQVVVSLTAGGLVWAGIIKIGYSGEIRPVEKLTWSFRSAIKRLLSGALIGLIISTFIVLLPTLIFESKEYGYSYVLPIFLFTGVISGLLGAMIGFLFGGFSHGKINTIMKPNEEIYRSAKMAIITLIAFVFSVGQVFGLLSLDILSYLGEKRINAYLVGVNFGVLLGLIFSMSFGGLAVIQHYTLRLILSFKNYAPRDYINFLDYAVDLAFLHKIGGGYIFIHKALLEYFASPKTDT